MSVSATQTSQATLEALRAAVEGKDFDALESLYAEDAVAFEYSERDRPSFAAELRGREAIVAGYREAPELTHEIIDGFAAGDRLALAMKCTYPSGQLVIATALLEVRDGQITRQVGVASWDE